MGFLVPLIAGIGSAIGGAATAVGGAVAGGSLLGTAATAGSLIGGAASVASALKGSPKLPAPILAPAATPTPQQIAPSGGAGTNKGLAALSPGLALSGTSSVLGSAPSGNLKTLLGQ